MAQPTLKLVYFDFRGRAETTRILLNYGGIKFEDVRVTFEEWPEFKKKTPFGVVPYLEVNGKPYGESKSIARYAAELVNLTGKDSLENLEINAIIDLLYDLEVQIVEYSFYEKDENRKKMLLEKLLNETLPSNFTKLDAIAKNNNGHLALKKITWADVYFSNLIEMANNDFKKDILEGYANLKNVIKNFVQVPKIKNYLLTRPAQKEFEFYDLKSEI